MNDAASKAYDATTRAAYEIVQSCVRSIEARIAEGEVTDGEDSLMEAIRTEVDDSLIYTNTHYILVWGLRNEEDAIESGSEPQSFGQALAAQAYYNLRSAVEAHDFSDALAVAADKRAETEGA